VSRASWSRSSAGLAAAISGVDHQPGVPKSPEFGRAATLAVGVLSVLVIFGGVVAAWPWLGIKPPGNSPRVGECASQKNPAVITVKLTVALGDPAQCPVTVPEASQLLVQADDKTVMEHFRLKLISTGMDTPLQFGEADLLWKSGPYNVFATPYATPNERNSAASVVRLAGQNLSSWVSSRFGATPPVPPASKLFALTITIRPISSLNSDTQTPPGVLNQTCWDGSLRGYANLPAVIEACQQAVYRANPNDRYVYVDGRGLNRALNRDRNGAIADFEYYVQKAPDRFLAAQRSSWIKQLKQGEDPFTPQVLDRITHEYRPGY
jgi:hypothetical protein